MNKPGTVRPVEQPRGEDFAVTINACKLCTPLGAVLAACGVRGALTMLHGSQGCATYIRRYLISHFREPLDVASSSFTEHAAVFGGRDQLVRGLVNLAGQYRPELILVATTCLAETIGEDVPSHLREARSRLAEAGLDQPLLCPVSTASYRGTHREGFQAAVLALVKACIEAGQNPATARTMRDPAASLAPAATPGGSNAAFQAPPVHVAQLQPPAGMDPGTHDASALQTSGPFDLVIFPGILSPADLRWLRASAGAFGLRTSLMPDYSATLDGGLWDDWQAIPPGGTPLEEIATYPAARAVVELGAGQGESAGGWLRERWGMPATPMEFPVGIAATDAFFDHLAALSGRALPPAMEEARQRLADAYVDAHKYVAGLGVLIYGEVDLVVAMAAWVREIGMVPAVCATGAPAGTLEARLAAADPQWGTRGELALDDSDFVRMEEAARERGLSMVIGSSKGYKLATALGLPLVRVGFPIHDRYGGTRILHLGYEGASQLFDLVVNGILAARQDSDTIGYTYF